MRTSRSGGQCPSREEVGEYYTIRFGKEPSDYFKARYEALYKAYKEALRRKGVSHEEAIKIAINSPSPRFWISIAKAYKQIRRKERGEDFSYAQGSLKRKVIEKVYEKYLYYRKLPTHRNKPIFTTVCWAVHSQAPSFYISYVRALKIITAINHGEANLY